MSRTRDVGSSDLCAICGRVTVALSPDQYTLRRADLIIEHGMCFCAGTREPVPPYDAPGEFG
ncbi:MAG TPA: hypothetical protein VGN37_25275 [Actinocatenispora sp.]